MKMFYIEKPTTTTTYYNLTLNQNSCLQYIKLKYNFVRNVPMECGGFP